MVDRVGCGAVSGRGSERGWGAGRPKSVRDNIIWGKETSHSVRRGRGGGGGADRKDNWGMWVGRIDILVKRVDWGGGKVQGLRGQGVF